ncbi:MAG: hypothetical protein WBR29_00320 [Gammaproteobacteria bacterium]
MNLIAAFSHALSLSFAMFWQIFWGLSLGFAFLAIILMLKVRSIIVAVLATTA